MSEISLVKRTGTPESLSTDLYKQSATRKSRWALRHCTWDALTSQFSYHTSKAQNQPPRLIITPETLLKVSKAPTDKYPHAFTISTIYTTLTFASKDKDISDRWIGAIQKTVNGIWALKFNKSQAILPPIQLRNKSDSVRRAEFKSLVSLYTAQQLESQSALGSQTSLGVASYDSAPHSNTISIHNCMVKADYPRVIIADIVLEQGISLYATTKSMLGYSIVARESTDSKESEISQRASQMSRRSRRIEGKSGLSCSPSMPLLDDSREDGVNYGSLMNILESELDALHVSAIKAELKHVDVRSETPLRPIGYDIDVPDWPAKNTGTYIVAQSDKTAFTKPTLERQTDGTFTLSSLPATNLHPSHLLYESATHLHKIYQSIPLLREAKVKQAFIGELTGWIGTFNKCIGNIAAHAVVRRLVCVLMSSMIRITRVDASELGEMDLNVLSERVALLSYELDQC